MPIFRRGFGPDREITRCFFLSPDGREQVIQIEFRAGVVLSEQEIKEWRITLLGLERDDGAELIGTQKVVRSAETGT